ncbi:MAG: hypothetical protein WCI73_12510 [Phycisphaerae bacterium]
MAASIFFTEYFIYVCPRVSISIDYDHASLDVNRSEYDFAAQSLGGEVAVHGVQSYGVVGDYVIGNYEEREKGTNGWFLLPAKLKLDDGVRFFPTKEELVRYLKEKGVTVTEVEKQVHPPHWWDSDMVAWRKSIIAVFITGLSLFYFIRIARAMAPMPGPTGREGGSDSTRGVG